jgi:hypothetical protein
VSDWFEIDHERDVVGQGASRRAHRRQVLIERGPADLDLHGTEAGGDGFLRLVGDVTRPEHPQAVVGGNGPRLAAEQRHQRDAGRHRERVPGGEIDPRDRHPL